MLPSLQPWQYYLGPIFLCVVLVEIVFYVVIKFILYPSLNRMRQPLPYRDHPADMITKILDELDSLTTYTKVDFIRGFFLGAKMEDIYEDNYKSFLAWVMFGIQETHLSDHQLQVIDNAYNSVCERLNIEPIFGCNRKVKHVAHSWDDVNIIHRPLFFYVGSKIFDLVTSYCMFYFNGFSYCETPDLKYWYHPGNGSTALTPIVFMHGITPGWLAYGFVIQSLLKLGRPIFLIEFDSIRVKSLHFSMPTPEKFSSSLKQVIIRHKFDRVSIIGHSFGTVTASWFIQQFPDMVNHITLIDPVSILLSLPTVAFSFLYRQPKTIPQYLIYYFASTELTISHCLRRNFFWYRSMLWFDEISTTTGIVVGIAGKDEITESKTVHEYCVNYQQHHPNLHVHYWSDFSHGQILFNVDHLNKLWIDMTNNEKSKIE